MRLISLLLISAPALFSQPKIPLAVSADDPKLFRYFFESPIPTAIAINPTDSPRFVSAFQTTNRNLAALEQYRQKYLALMLGEHKRPDPKTLSGFEASKNLEGVAGTYRMRRTLSPQGWQQVRTHVNTVFLPSLNPGH